MTAEEIQKQEQQEQSQKHVEYYAASVNAWFNTSLEHDKSLLALSAGGIGLLITLLTTVGLSSAEALVLYVVAIACFVVALVVILIIFRRNRTHIEEILSGNAENDDPILSKLDLAAIWAFGLGVVFTAIIGIAAAVHSYAQKEKHMENERSKPKGMVLEESFNGASKLQDPTKSFNGAANIRPQPTSSTNSSSPSNSTSSGAPSNPSQGGKERR